MNYEDLRVGCIFIKMQNRVLRLGDMRSRLLDGVRSRFRLRKQAKLFSFQLQTRCKTMNYAKYLRSKITVDDRALNMGVLQSLEEYVKHAMSTSPSEYLRVVEVGAGVGAMFARLYRRKLLFQSCKSVEYTLIDIKEEVLNAASEDLMQLLESETNLPLKKPVIKSTSSNTTRHANVEDRNTVHTSGIDNGIETTVARMEFPGDITVNIVLCDAVKYLTNNQDHFDLVIAAAVLDLWQVEEVLPVFEGCLNPSSKVRAFYFPINFDGVTDFFPSSSLGLSIDDEVVNIFHNSMGYRKTVGEVTLSCHTGRRLIPALQEYGASLISVGSSAWTVYPNADRSYNANEKYFLSCVISFIEETVNRSGNTHLSGGSDAFQKYLDSRRKQLEDGTLYYLAHNIDVFCVV